MEAGSWIPKDARKSLAVLAVLLVLVLQLSGGLRVAPGGPDTEGYLALRGLRVPEALAGVGTVGYPILLNLTTMASPTLEVLPYLQVGLHIFGVFCFLAGLGALGIGGLTATLICGSLLFSNLALGSSRLILTDAPASSLAIMAIGHTLVVVGGRRGVWPWVGLAGATFLAYQIRPAYIFLVPFVPLLGLGLALLALETEDVKARWKTIGVALVAATFLPFLSFCCLRWIITGQFGLASSSGSMSIGVVGQFLDDDLVADLPADLRVLAGRALIRRQELPDLRVSDAGEMADRSRIESRHAATQLMFVNLMAPIQKDSSWLLQFRGKQDNLLSRLSLEIIRRRPRLYLYQVAKEFRAGLKVCILNHDASLFMLLALGALQVCSVFRGRRPGYGCLPSPSIASAAYRSLSVMFLISMTFCVSKLLLVVLILPPVERYLAAAGVFMPSLVAIPLAVALQSAETWRRNR